MKKLFVILTLMLFGQGVNAQNIYVLGDYFENQYTDPREKIAAVYKNGELLYTTPSANRTVFPKTILCDSNENVYWMVDCYGYSEIWKNDQLFVTTKNTNKSIGNIYLENDTIYYAGSETVDGVSAAKVWKGENFTPYQTLGDGVHSSAIRNLNKDKTTGKIYYCGYFRPDTIDFPAVWSETELLYTIASNSNLEATEICIDQGDIYIFSKIGSAYMRVCKNQTTLFSDGGYYNNQYYDFCVKDNDWYTYRFGFYGDHAIIKNGDEVVLDFGYCEFVDHNYPITNLKLIGNDIYATGFYEQDHKHVGAVWKNFELFQVPNNHCSVVGDVCFSEQPFLTPQSEWYYEILNDDGSTTYQYLNCVGDTTISSERPKIIVRTNQIYDKYRQTEVTREYVFEKDGVVYWWNKELEVFTVLYNFNAEVGDVWEIKVGTENIVMHVDAVEQYEYEGRNYKMLRVSDLDNVFSGNIVCGIGHLTSFFPEKLMHRGKGYRVEGIRCYWLAGKLVFRYGDKDCDAIYEVNHHSVGESVAETGLLIYPNPTDGLLHIVGLPQCGSPTGQTEYRITNLMGQTLLTGILNGETIDISALSNGIYLLKVDNTTFKIVVNQ